jgi:hypothetical protein
MTDTKKRIEQGKDNRVPATKDTFVGLKPDYSIIGQVKNIGMDGLTFTYMANGQRPSQPFKLDIFLVDRTFLLEEVPFKTTTDVALDGIPFSSLTMRECTVQFEDLTPHQKDEIEYFMINHSVLGVITH